MAKAGGDSFSEKTDHGGLRFFIRGPKLPGFSLVFGDFCGTFVGFSCFCFIKHGSLLKVS